MYCQKTKLISQFKLSQAVRQTVQSTPPYSYYRGLLD